MLFPLIIILFGMISTLNGDPPLEIKEMVMPAQNDSRRCLCLNKEDGNTEWRLNIPLKQKQYIGIFYGQLNTDNQFVFATHNKDVKEIISTFMAFFKERRFDENTFYIRITSAAPKGGGAQLHKEIETMRETMLPYNTTVVRESLCYQPNNNTLACTLSKAGYNYNFLSEKPLVSNKEQHPESFAKRVWLNALWLNAKLAAITFKTVDVIDKRNNAYAIRNNSRDKLSHADTAKHVACRE